VTRDVLNALRLAGLVGGVALVIRSGRGFVIIDFCDLVALSICAGMILEGDVGGGEEVGMNEVFLARLRTIEFGG